MGHRKLSWDHDNQEEIWWIREESQKLSTGWRKEQTILSHLKENDMRQKQQSILIKEAMFLM